MHVKIQLQLSYTVTENQMTYDCSNCFVAVVTVEFMFLLDKKPNDETKAKQLSLETRGEFRKVELFFIFPTNKPAGRFLLGKTM